MSKSILQDNNEKLIDAVRFNDAEQVRKMIPISDPRYLQSHALRLAARMGHPQCLKLLIPVSDCDEFDYEALIHASIKGNVECVRLLIAHSNTHACSTALGAALLRESATDGHKHCAQALYDVSDLKETLRQISYKNIASETMADLKKRINIQEEHALLSDVVGDAHSSSIRKKM